MYTLHVLCLSGVTVDQNVRITCPVSVRSNCRSKRTHYVSVSVRSNCRSNVHITCPVSGIPSKHKTFMQQLYNDGPTVYKCYINVLGLLINCKSKGAFNIHLEYN